MRETESSLRRFLERSPLPICFLDCRSLKFLSINQAFLRRFGYSKREILARNIHDLLASNGSLPFAEERLTSKNDLPLISHVQVRKKNGQTIEQDALITPAVLRRKPAYFCELIDVGVSVNNELGHSLEEEVFRQRAQLKAILENSPSMIFVKDLAGRYVLVNHEFERRFQFERGSVLGKTDAQIFHREQARQFRAHDRIVMESTKATEFEEQAQYDDGSHTSIVVKYPLFDLDGTMFAIGGIVTDITERKRDEKAVRVNEQSLRQFVDTLPAAVYVCDAHGMIEMYNMRATELWGREPKIHDLSDRFCGSFRMYSKDGTPLAHVKSPMAEAIRTGSGISGQSIIIERPDGSRREAVVDIVPRRDASGTLTGAVNCLTDITRMELAESKFRGLLEAAPDAMVIADQDGTIRLVNSQTESMFGFQRTELLGMSVELLVPERYRGRHPLHRSSYSKDPVKRTMGAGLDLYGLRKDGSEFPVDISLSPFETEDGVMVIAAIRDITERKRAAMDLQETHDTLRALGARLESIREEEKENIAREVHDELGQLLTALKMDLTLLAEEVDSLGSERQLHIGDSLEGMLTLADTAIQRTRDITAELRPPILDHLGLKSAVEWLVSELQKRTKIESSVEANVDEIILDRTRSIAVFRIIQEALTNIVRHSAATKAGIRIHQSSDQLRIGVWDNGKGIRVGRLLDIRSLGLFGMKERATLIGGELSINSSADSGTEIVVVIPVDHGGESAGSNNT